MARTSIFLATLPSPIEAQRIIMSVLNKVREHVLQRRVRILETLKGYDPLRKHLITTEQFKRGLIQAVIPLKKEELEALSIEFQEPGAKLCDQALVNYQRFNNEVERVFSDDNLAQSIRDASHQTKQTGDSDQLHQVLQKIAIMCKAKGVSLKYSFKDFDNLNTGNVTLSQFIRGFPFDAEFSKKEIHLLVTQYGSTSTGTQTVNYRLLHVDVSELDSPAVDPVKSGDMFACHQYETKPKLHWQSDDLSPLQKIQARVYLDGSNMIPVFRQFDHLSHGHCDSGHAQTAFTLLNISSCLSAHEQHDITKQYTILSSITSASAGSQFDYRKFCSDVEAAISAGSLNANPLAKVDVPDTATLLKFRKDAQKLTEDESRRLQKLEFKLKDVIRKRELDLLRMFRAYDSLNTQHVTNNQFERVLSSCGIVIDSKDAHIIEKKFCNLGNEHDFNYREFCIELCNY